MRKMLADQPDILFHFCNDPSKAVDTASQVRPTVILQDLVMPDIDGLTLIKLFRASPFTKDIPLIVLSAKEEPGIKASAFRLGANDCMVKLPDRLEVIARIRHHSASYARLLQRNQKYKELEESQRVLYAELSDAATYVLSLLPDPIQIGDVQADWRFIPSALLGGDALGYSWIDADRFAFYVIDVCGHGVGATLLTISIINLLRSPAFVAEKFSDPREVLAALNTTFPMQKNNEMFFTMWYGIYHKQQRLLKYSSGGHPPAVLVDVEAGGNKKVTELKVQGPMIGVTADAQFSLGSCSIAKGCRLYLYSDGIYELEKEDGRMLSFDEFLINFHQPAEHGVEEIDRILNFSKNIVKHEPFLDDVSILELRF